MKYYHFILVAFIFTLFTFGSFAEEFESETSLGAQFAYYFDDHQGYDNKQSGGFVPPNYNPVSAPGSFIPHPTDYANVERRTIGSGWGAVELQLYLKHSIKIPFLVTDGALTEDNNIKFKFDLFVAPIAAYFKGAAEITPISFLKFNIGAMIGTGWNLVIFNGLGDNNKGLIDTGSFPGAVTKLWSTATFQFDLAALFPGEWNHIVALASVTFNYNYFTTEKAIAGNPWQWLADAGENFNGWDFETSFFIGYQMPLFLNTVGFLVETSKLLGKNSAISPMALAGGWGSDFVEVTFSPLVKFAMDDHNSLAVLIQFQTGRDYSDDTIFNQFFMNRDYESTYVELRRLVLAYNYQF